MNLKEEEAEIKKEFQLERVILFTDAVFAIILTIMVLELKLPEDIKDDVAKIDKGFGILAFKLIAYALTFSLVARFWVVHLKLFRYLKDYDIRLITYNLLFLFSVSLYPSAVSLLAGSISPKLTEYSWAWAAYVFVFCSVSFTQTLICQYLIEKKDTLCINVPDIETTYQWKVQRLNFIFAPAAIIIVIVLLYMNVRPMYMQYTAVAYGVLIGRFTRKYYPDNNNAPLIKRLFRKKRHVKQIPKTDSE